MQLELTQDEQSTLRTALEIYLSDLRQEIVKTEKYELRQALHQEEEVLKRVIQRLA